MVACLGLFHVSHIFSSSLTLMLFLELAQLAISLLLGRQLFLPEVVDQRFDLLLLLLDLFPLAVMLRLQSVLILVNQKLLIASFKVEPLSILVLLHFLHFVHVFLGVDLLRFEMMHLLHEVFHSLGVVDSLVGLFLFLLQLYDPGFQLDLLLLRALVAVNSLHHVCVLILAEARTQLSRGLFERDIHVAALCVLSWLRHALLMGCRFLDGLDWLRWTH